MTNTEITRLLRQIAAAYSITDEKKYRFQIIAYQKAADNIESIHTEITDLYREGKLKTLPGIGASMQNYLQELCETGQVKHFEEVLATIPEAVYPLLDIPSFGPKKAYKLVTAFQLASPENVMQDVMSLAKKGKIAPLAGFGEKSQSDIIRALEEYALGKTKTARMVLPYANELAEKIVAYLKKSPDVLHVSPLGSLRRKRETVGDIDMAVATNHPAEVLTYFTQYPGLERVIEKGDRTSSIIVSSGKQIDLMVQPPEAFGSLLQHFTGSKAHNVHLREYALTKRLSLSEYGIRKKDDPEKKLTQYATEEAFYQALELDWIPPEIREDTGEIELARDKTLPKLLELKDMKGDFHIHPSYPIEPSHDMGRDSMETMLDKAISLNYEYLGFSEHHPSTGNHTKEQIMNILIKRKEYIDKLKEKYNKNIRIFSLLEIDIQPNGNLAMDDDALALLDGAIVSIHSGFSMDKQQITDRILKGLSHPKAKILAHPTGRLLNQRAGYEVDWERIFAFCEEHHKALEINASPLRLDLSDILVREAVKRKIPLFIDTDSHAVDQMELMEYGVSVARRGWATKDDIVNALPYNEVVEWFNK
ncbi:MAG: hypothetical protein AAB553_04980 [Patescibacteria group bacterium]